MGDIFLSSNSIVKKGKKYFEKNHNQHIKVYSYDRSLKKNPVMDEYFINTNNHGPMVLDALLYIRKKFKDVAFRSSCREGICGSCGMNINGENVLACSTKVSKYAGRTIYVRPMPHMTVQKDLAVDMSRFFNQYKEVKPWMMNKDIDSGKQKKNKEVLQKQEDRKKLDGLYDCILCACCSTSCPSYWWNQDRGFLGPAALLMAQRWIEDSRDTEKKKRLKSLNSESKLYRCHTILNCIHSCPKSLNPAKAISRIKKLIDHELGNEDSDGEIF